jgi:hypothetical protein
VEADIPGMRVLRPDGTHRIGANFAKECQGSLETVLCIKLLIEACYSGGAIAIRLNSGSGSVAIQMGSIGSSSFAHEGIPARIKFI